MSRAVGLTPLSSGATAAWRTGRQTPGLSALDAKFRGDAIGAPVARSPRDAQARAAGHQQTRNTRYSTPNPG